MPKTGTTRKTTTTKRAKSAIRPKRPNPTTSPQGDVPTPPVSHDEIAARAYALFLERGGQDGDDWSDWFRAEAELASETPENGGPGVG